MPVNPFLDETGLLRVGGHLTTLTHDAKFPIILLKKDEHVESLIRQEHELQGHAGVNHVFESLRCRWYILGGRETIRWIIHHCIHCQKLFKDPRLQKMVPLLADRLDVCSL